MLKNKKYFYVYYSYEPWGRGYIGKRECWCLPEEDTKYFGSFRDKTFKPTEKIISEKTKGKVAPNKGKSHSEETKRKISEKRKQQCALRKLQQQFRGN